MNPIPDHCPHCGARVARPGEQGTCAFCGTGLPLAVPVEPRQAQSSERFRRLAQDPRLPEILQRPPSSAGPGIALGFGVLATGGFVVFAIFLAFKMAPPMSGSGGFFALIPLLVVGVGLFALGRVIFRGARYAGAELRHELALAVDERTSVSGGGNSAARTRYFVTLENEAGARRELETSARVAGLVAAGDLGVAWTRDDRLVEFVRVAV